MCGIVGIVGLEKPLGISLELLRSMEYRGYDSFGFSTMNSGVINTYKRTGSISSASLTSNFLAQFGSGVAIAHTRWATHGKITAENAHPHVSGDGAFALIHNGVIANFKDLKDELERQATRFVSSTDSEVIVHLIATYYAIYGSMELALKETNGRLEGEYSYLVISTHDPDAVYGSCNGSTLCYGVTDSGVVVASDQIAVSMLTDKAVYFEDHDIFKIQADGIHFLPADADRGANAPRLSIKIPYYGRLSFMDNSDYMLSEIHETPRALGEAMLISEQLITSAAESLLGKNLTIVGAGSSYFVASLGRYYFAQISKQQSTAYNADEYLNLCIPRADSHMIAISQSGETFDTVQAVRNHVGRNLSLTSITNVNGSTCHRLATTAIFQNSGVERSVLSTKSVTTQALILYRISLKAGHLSGALTSEQYRDLVSDGNALPMIIEHVLSCMSDDIRRIASANAQVKNWFFIGNNLNFPVAMESALKFKEVSYVHAEGLSSGSLKHGSLSLICDDFKTIAFVANKQHDRDSHQYIAGHISEIAARGGEVIQFSFDETHANLVSETGPGISIPSINKYLDSVTGLVVGQLFAYYTAKALDRNVDRPRALAKAVTVR